MTENKTTEVLKIMVEIMRLSREISASNQEVAKRVEETITLLSTD